MSLSKMALLAAGLTLALSTTALSPRAHAQSPQNTPMNMLGDVGEDEAVIISPKTGKIQKVKLQKGKGHFAKAQKMGAREIKGGMLMRRDGKLYLLEDKPGKAPTKSMMQEEFQDMFDVNQY